MKKSKILIIVIAVLDLLIVLGVFGYLVYNKNKRAVVEFAYRDETKITTFRAAPARRSEHAGTVHCCRANGRAFL